MDAPAAAQHTPVEDHGGVLVKRDDTYDVEGSRGGKVRTCMALGRAALAAGQGGLVTAGSRQSPQVNIVATVAAHLGLACRVHVPSGDLTPELEAAQAAGAEVVQHRPGYNTVIVARARADAAERGWAEVPFGMECAEAVEQTAAEVASLAGVSFGRLVVPVGSGMSLAGILAGLDAQGISVPVLGVQVGADPRKRLDRWAPGWEARVQLVASELDYHQPAPAQQLGQLHLDPIYEAKCLPYLAEGDLLWVVGIRATAAPTAPPAAPQHPDGSRHGVRPELVEQGLLVPIDSLVPHPDNPNNGDVDAIAGSLQTNGQYRPIATWRRGDDEPEVILAGNTTYAAAMQLGWTHLARTYVRAESRAEAVRILLADNRYARLAVMDTAAELALLAELDDLAGTGYSYDDMRDLADAAAALEAMPLDPEYGLGDEAGPGLAERFGVVPFTVLDARSGPWRTRKREWLAMGIESELGRDGLMTGLAASAAAKARYDGVELQQKAGSGYGSDVSVFDPVLCELVYRWHTRAGARVLDPYAGGSVRGLVAARLGRGYTGVELRGEQVEANKAQLGLLGKGDPEPEWLQGDASDVLQGLPRNSYDLVFSCPPYYGLERYSDDPRDLSAMSEAGFNAAYAEQLGEAARCLKPDSFAVLVVGQVRSPGGALQDLVGVTVDAMAEAGCALYNDAIMVTPAGSLPVRAGRAFVATRVLGRTHQYVLVFLKGERKRAVRRAGEVDLAGTLEAAEALAEQAADV